MSAQEKETYNSATDEILGDCSFSGVFEQKEVGVRRIDSIVLPSNVPSEDVTDRRFVKFSDTLIYSMFAVFDGHNGNAMSKALEEKLFDALFEDLALLYSAHAAASNPDPVVVEDHVPVEGLNVGEKQDGMIENLYKGMPHPNPSEETIDQCIKEAFTRVDTWVVHDLAQEALDNQTSKGEAVKLLATAGAGSCALVGIYNNVKRTLKVALTGHSRAVLGRRVALEEDTYAYETHVLSADQNGYNPHEVERLETAHPGEEIFENERMLDWGMTRAFGNAAYKLSLEIQQRIHEEYFGNKPWSDCLTPPYFTAEPVTTTTTIRQGDFVVLASSGFWEHLTNEEVVGLVGAWLETRGKEVRIEKDEGIGEGEMVMLPIGKTVAAGKRPMSGFGKGKGNGWPESSNGGKTHKEDEITIWERTDLPVTSLKPDATPKRFINIDDNAAIHLARSALGGADKELTGALLQLPSPRSLKYRDDISVLVVFFN